MAMRCSSTKSAVKPAAMTKSGVSSAGSIVGPPARNTLAGWCKVFHQSTENLMMGMLMALVGAINIPIIKFSVDWWNTLHQPASVFRAGGPTIDPALLTPLFVMAAGFTALFVLLHLIAMRAEILRRRVRALQQTQVARAALAEA